MIDTAAFTPLQSLLGGALIGLSAAGLLLVNGRIAGISGLLGGLIPPRNGAAVAATFLGGLILAPVVLAAFGRTTPLHIDASMPVLVIAGLLVGIGTRHARGCTSGHGVCGISRLSRRSILATAIFMAAAITTVWLEKQLLS